MVWWMTDWEKGMRRVQLTLLSQLWLNSCLVAPDSFSASCPAHACPPLGFVSGCLGQITLAGAQADARLLSTEQPLCWDDKPQSQANIWRMNGWRGGKVSWGEGRPEWKRRAGDKEVKHCWTELVELKTSPFRDVSVMLIYMYHKIRCKNDICTIFLS